VTELAATTAERELMSIWDARGSLTPGMVVEEARPEGHPLHGYFEWDDKVAGAAYRCEQAAQLIRSVKITIAVSDEEKHQVRAWLPARYAGDEDSPKGSYLPTTAIESADQRAVMLRQMKREAAAFQRRYSHLAEYWSTVEELAARPE
jgi:hypothetical protein